MPWPVMMLVVLIFHVGGKGEEAAESAHESKLDKFSQDDFSSGNQVRQAAAIVKYFDRMR